MFGLAWTLALPAERVGQHALALGATRKRVCDLAVNRLWKTNASSAGTQVSGYTYNANDQLEVESTGSGSLTNRCDAHGALTNRGSASETRSCTYDLERRSSGAQWPQQTNRYFYDQTGLRTRGELPGTVSATNLVLNDPQSLSGYAQALDEWRATGGGTNLSRVYSYGLALASQRAAAGTLYYFVQDGHGLPRLLVNGAGVVTNTYSYDAYGNLIPSNAPPQNCWLYCGEQFDPHLGMYYLRARYYKPDTSRLWTQDSKEGDQEEPQSLHLYLYCQADPVNNTDPSGNEIEGLTTVMEISFTLASPKIAGEPQGRVVHGRPLTQGEINLSKTLFGSKIDYSLPKVFNRPWIIQSREYGVTPNGNIYARGDGTSSKQTGGAYRADFSTEGFNTQVWFIHEMTHVWQHQQGMWVVLRRGFWASYDYDFSKLGTKDFKKYGIEQQAEIVADLFMRKNGYTGTDKWGNAMPSLQTYQKVTSPYFP